MPGANGNCSCNRCPYMALNTMEKIYLALRDETPKVRLKEKIRIAARKPLKRMFSMVN